MEKKILFFDIDGTLIDCRLGIYEIPETTKQSLLKLQQLGHRLFLATGRCKCFIVDGVMSFPFDGYVTCNGAYVEYNEQCVFKKIIPLKAIKATHDFCKKHDIAYYFEANDIIYTIRKDHPRHLDFQNNWQMNEKVVTDVFDLNTIETYIGMIVLNKKEEVKEMKEVLTPYFDIQQHHTELSFDLTLKEVSKAVGITKLVEAINEDMQSTMAFGDGNNDLEMLKTVEIGISMGNAVKSAKNISDYITDRVENDGITKALQYFKLL